MTPGPIMPSDGSAVESEAFPFEGDGDPPLLTAFQTEGLIYAVNKLILHPLGWALGVSGVGTVDRFKASGFALFRTDDPEGIVYDSTDQDVRGIRRLADAGHTDLIDLIQPLLAPDSGEPERGGMDPRYGADT